MVLPSQTEVRYPADDPIALASFLMHAGIRLVRADYLWFLCNEKKLIPRRQEAEHEFFDGTERQSALVTHGEVQKWAREEVDACIFSISHCWESQELEGSGHKVKIYHAPTGAMKEVTLKELTMNLVEYLLRGWCQAELEWSSTRSDSISHQRIDEAEDDADDAKEEDAEDAEDDVVSDLGSDAVPILKTKFKSKMPLPPEEFEKKMQSLQFTHRSDTEAVLHLQRTVFMEKVSTSKCASFAHMDDQELHHLVQSLRHYTCLESFTLSNFNCEIETMEELCEWFKQVLRGNALTELVIKFSDRNEEQAFLILKAIAEVLPENSSLTRFRLLVGDCFCFPPASGLQALAEAMRKK